MRRSWTQMIAGSIALLLLLAGCAMPWGGKGNKSAEGPELAWEPKRIRATIEAGDSKEFIASFTSPVDLTNVELVVTDEIIEAVTVEPATIPKVAANAPVEVTVTIAVPADGPTSYKGRLNARSGDRKLGNSFQIEVVPTE